MQGRHPAARVSPRIRYNMDKSDFYFELPEELIAQTPIERREQSRLLCLDRFAGQTEHRKFFELPEFLRAGDCLVLNDSRVMPARLLGTRESGGAAEVLLLRELTRTQGDGSTVSPRDPHSTGMCSWECLVRPGRKIKTGTKLIFGGGELTAVVTGEKDGNRLIEFTASLETKQGAKQETKQGVKQEAAQAGGSSGKQSQAGEARPCFTEVLERLGKMPLPPYIHTELNDNERYQTVYSREIGSAAAPTAGLHFTDELLEALKARGVEICFMTLHVGLGTFRPVKTQEIEKHKMHSEFFIIPEETAEKVNRVKSSGGRVVAVGTTSCRALESSADEKGSISQFSGFTDIFIYPGYKFKCIDGLITNFHLPESTLIMLVSAFAGRENVLRAYNEAISERYRFFSFGDAMLIL